MNWREEEARRLDSLDRRLFFFLSSVDDDVARRRCLWNRSFSQRVAPIFSFLLAVSGLSWSLSRKRRLVMTHWSGLIGNQTRERAADAPTDLFFFSTSSSGRRRRRGAALVSSSRRASSSPLSTSSSSCSLSLSVSFSPSAAALLSVPLPLRRTQLTAKQT